MKNNRIQKIIAAFMACSFILITGCGSKKITKKELAARGMLCNFEVLPSETAIGDFDWETNGYVKLEQFKKYATRGKHSAQAIFSVPSDFLSPKETAAVPSWIAGITMSINTLTKLKVTDWSPYKKFSFDIFVPDESSYDLGVNLFDGSGRMFTSTMNLVAGRNKLELILSDVKTAGLNLKNITAFTLFMDTKRREKAVTLYIDNVRLVP